MVTMKDIAKLCGVSVSTVSRVLSGNTLISPETTRLVTEAAEKLGYRPDMTARTLKTNRSDLIGILYDAPMTHPFFSGVIDAIRTRAEEAGFDVLLLSRVKRNGRMDYTETALSRRMDGIVVIYADVESENVRKLAKGNIPVISIDVYAGQTSAVLSDYREGTRKLTEYAISRGHSRIALIHGQMGYVTQKRLEGFRATMKAEGLAVPEQYIRASSFNNPEECARETEELLSLPEPPTCILMPDDYSAINALRILEEKGISAPEQFSCAGYDGIPLSQAKKPQLTTFWQDTEGIGRAAIEALLNSMLKGPEANRVITINGKLIPGGTVADLRKQN